MRYDPPRRRWVSANLASRVRQPWVVFVAIGLGVVAAFYTLPDLQDALYLLIGFSAAAAVVAGRWMHKPVQRGWRTLAAGIALYSLGDLIYTILTLTTGTEPFPSLADGPYVAGQLLVVIGIARLAAPIERGLYRPALIDAALVATAGAFVAWPLVLDPMAASQPDPLGGLVALSYPLLDLVLIGVLARHLLQPGRKTPSVLLLLIGGVAWLVADLVYAGLSTSGDYVSGGWLDAGWLIAYIFVGASALHPSMARVVSSPETHEATVSNGRLVLVGLNVMIPVIVFVIHGPLTRPGDFVAFAIGSATLGALGCARLLGALHASRVMLMEQRELKGELLKRARTDRLTGLANREVIIDRIATILGRQEPVGFVFLDLDDFKRVNDAFGHPTGQGVLREVADRLRSIPIDGSGIARLGGDEFGLVVSPCALETDVVAVGLAVIEALRPEVALGGHRFRIHASIGLVWSNGGDLTAAEILARADIAMYQAKGRGGDGYAVFAPEMHERAVARTQLQSDLDGAVTRGEIEPWFQPIFDVETLNLVAVEALARWNHPERGLLAPDAFIPIAEQSGAIAAIDHHIIRVATERVADWNSLLGVDLQLHVNITPREAADPATVVAIASALAKSELPAGCLVVEVTETALIDETGVAPVLARLKQLGVRLSIDDFGSRYAVLTQLGRLPIDIVKLDRSVLSGIGTQTGLQLFQGIIRLAQSLDLETVAEGIESTDVLPVLRRLGCTAAQGYALGRPMPAAAFARLVLTYSDAAAIA
jgi:diguanylate cyclase (GGDEF)-like protein